MTPVYIRHEGNSMTKYILLLGRTSIVVENVQHQLQMPDIQLFGGTGLDDVWSLFARTSIDHVIIGGGLELETRLEIVREIFRLSDTTTVHMKDVASGPEGFLPFVRSVLRGLQDGRTFA
ncbi:MAG: hypothetical protein ACXVDA_16985 [Ktedonobacterales bacterium]